MPGDKDTDASRRHFLKVAGPAGVALLAGCPGQQGGDGGAEETPADTDTATPEPTPEETPTDTPEETPTETPEETTTQLRLTYDTHFHGRLGSRDEARNAANYFGLAQEVLADAPGHSMMLGGGDDLHMSVMSSVLEGQHMVEVLNESPIAYDTYGNHEFDLGPGVARDAVADSDFGWVSANVLDAESGDAFAAEQGAARYATEDVGDVTVGITGLAPANTPEVTSVGENVEVLDPVEAAADVVSDLEDEGVDVTILLNHLASPTAEELAGEVDGIDLVVADHAAFVEEEVLEVNDTLLSFVGDELDYLGQLDLEIEDGEVADYEFQLHDVVSLAEEGEVTAHEGIDGLHQQFNAQLDEELGVVIGETTTEIDVRRQTVRQRESGFANYIADVIREDTGADVVIQNGGGIRSDQLYEPGDITRRLVVDILPFPNDTCAVEMTGETIRAAIEHGVGQVSELDGRFPQVSGMSFAYDPEAEAGNRVEEVTVGGEPIDDSATYTVGTNDFLLGGGDGYEMIANAEVVRPPDEGQLLSAAVSLSIEEDGTISPEPEGRIDVLSGGSGY